MWDGWETRRRRGPGHDWATFRLGMPGTVEQVLVDTTHFKGNAPGWVSVDLSDDDESWSKVADRVPVGADRVNTIDMGAPTHGASVRLSIHPDGGVARFRVLGRPDSDAAAGRRMEYLNALFEEDALRFFITARHTEAQIRRTVDAVAEEFGKIASTPPASVAPSNTR